MSFIGNSPYIFGGTQIYATFLCKNSLADYVTDEFGKNTSVHPAGTDHFYFRFKSSETNTLFFAQQYLDAVILVDPPELKEKFINSLLLALSKYNYFL